MTNTAAIGIICKAPRPGATKTRLADMIGGEAAATLSACFLRDVAACTDQVPQDIKIGRRYGVNIGSRLTTFTFQTSPWSGIVHASIEANLISAILRSRGTVGVGVVCSITELLMSMRETPDDLVASGMQLFDQFVAKLPDRLAQSYFLSHRARFEKTLSCIPPADSGGHAVELAATDFFQVSLKSLYGYSVVSGTQKSANIEEKLYYKIFEIGKSQTRNLIVSIDLESELLPFADESIDLIICCEVIEHLDVDPMFMLAEINRVCKLGAHVLLTTPNCCSARNFWKIAHGCRPHFFMQYEKSRSPYRHNIEYDVSALVTLVTAAGFEPQHVETHDVFEPTLPEAIELLKTSDLPLNYRGDGIFLLARKLSGINDRWPQGIYV